MPHPFVRLRMADDAVSYRSGDATAWTRLSGTALVAFGEAHACAELIRDLIAAGTVSPHRIELPRLADLGKYLPVSQQVDWALLWTVAAPAASGHGVVALGVDDYDEINEVLESALPSTHNRPGNSNMRGWYGIRDRGELVAVAGDRRENGLGYIAGVAVRPRCQGAGFGNALIRWLTGRLVAEFGTCALGVTNLRSDAFFTRLGYGHRLDLSTAVVSLG